MLHVPSLVLTLLDSIQRIQEVGLGNQRIRIMTVRRIAFALSAA